MSGRIALPRERVQRGTGRSERESARQPVASVDLYWLPLGAGGHSVRLNGRIFEWVAARLARRERCDLYHSALEVRVPEGHFVVEQTPAGRGDRAEQGVVAEGAVGTRAAGRFRLFRYEVRRWRDGFIPDLAEAVESPQHLSDNPDCARRLLDLVPQVPTPVWGRDEPHAGEMWNSNSIISWLVTRSGLDVDSIDPPAHGRAPGWQAGIAIALREQAQTTERPLARDAALDDRTGSSGSGEGAAGSSHRRAAASEQRTDGALRLVSRRALEWSSSMPAGRRTRG